MPITYPIEGRIEIPLSSSVVPVTGPIRVGAVDESVGEEKNKPPLTDSIFSLNCETPAGFHIVGEGMNTRAEIIDFLGMV